MVKAYSRGWKIYFDGTNWRYSDNHKIVDDSRPCKRCGRMPTKEGYDACLGYIDGARPFIDNTIEEIENTNLVEDALSKGLKKRNYDVF